ncbi:hypothetical protein BDP27DRAFT_1367130 [Rhodocollybia butyracea]|uniref:Uncharacterized protein n=1 Tax=Rhodocollybia butyracea TaxID=206335 RepID=A0A9P5PMC9_9AGAR|nr:hypothetical protein BDP27DRAFT_1367130 [Rhodocollybia butyracea]
MQGTNYNGERPAGKYLLGTEMDFLTKDQVSDCIVIVDGAFGDSRVVIFEGKVGNDSKKTIDWREQLGDVNGLTSSGYGKLTHGGQVVSREVRINSSNEMRDGGGSRAAIQLTKADGGGKVKHFSDCGNEWILVGWSFLPGIGLEGVKAFKYYLDVMKGKSPGSVHHCGQAGWMTIKGAKRVANNRSLFLNTDWGVGLVVHRRGGETRARRGVAAGLDEAHEGGFWGRLVAVNGSFTEAQCAGAGGLMLLAQAALVKNCLLSEVERFPFIPSGSNGKNGFTGFCHFTLGTFGDVDGRGCTALKYMSGGGSFSLVGDSLAILIAFQSRKGHRGGSRRGGIRVICRRRGCLVVGIVGVSHGLSVNGFQWGKAIVRARRMNTIVDTFRGGNGSQDLPG